MHRHFLVVVGQWKFEGWHLYHYVQTSNVKGNVTWMKWERIF